MSMNLTMFLAKVYGIVFTAVGLGMLINAKYYRKNIDDLIKNPGVMYLGGAIALVVGFLIATYHNLWVKDWRVLITVFGWIALLKGIMLLVFPKSAMNLSVGMLKKENFMVWGAVTLILGIIVGYFGFFGA